MVNRAAAICKHLHFQVLHLDHLAEGALTESVDDFVCKENKELLLDNCAKKQSCWRRDRFIHYNIKKRTLFTIFVGFRDVKTA